MPAIADRAHPSTGGHALPAHLAGSSPTPRPVSAPRRRAPRRGVVIGVVGALVIAGVLGGLQTASHLGYDDARVQFDAALESTQSTTAEVGLSTDELSAAADTGSLLIESDSGVLSDARAKEALTSSIARAEDATASAEEDLDRPLPSAEKKPSFFWELYGATEQLQKDLDELDDLDSAMATQAPRITAATEELTEAGVAFVASAAASAPAFEAAHISARNDDVIALRDSAATASGAMSLDDSAVSSFVALQDAAAQVISGEKSELAEKAGPLQSTRLDIEAFARSLAPGVLLEFDWNPIVNGAGDNGSMGGLTTWWWDEPDRAIIELSNSVAEQWPGDRSRALVAHEVGHAISVKCEDSYDSSTADSIEKWATAWAISMGFTDDANGVWAYGYPPQSYIDAAAGCR